MQAFKISLHQRIIIAALCKQYTAILYTAVHVYYTSMWWHIPVVTKTKQLTVLYFHKWNVHSYM